LQDAKAHFSELFRLALDSGPQRVTRHGRAAVIVVSEEDYHRLLPPPERTTSLARFFAESPLAELTHGPERSRDLGRPVDL
jgi:prevent-host-death family protein